MAKQEEVILREWDFGNNVDVTLSDLKNVLTDIVEATEMNQVLCSTFLLLMMPLDSGTSGDVAIC